MLNGKGLVFSEEMVKATLDDRKTKTRRAVLGGQWVDMVNGEYVSPYGKVGDCIWVRESISVRIGATISAIECGEFTYKADDTGGLWTKDTGFRTISGRFMWKWMARIWLKITDIDVQRLQDITKEDAIAEGMYHDFYWSKEVGEYRFSIGHYDAYRANFRRLWDKFNGKRAGGAYSWENNPWVWVITFKRLKGENYESI